MTDPTAWAEATALQGYFDACATTPPSAGVLAAMEQAQRVAWANPSSLHGPGLLAAESLERSRQTLMDALGAQGSRLTFTSGASEAIHLALLGLAADHSHGRLVISAVEHPATVAAAAALERQGWSVVVLPVNRLGLIRLEELAAWLQPPTRLVSLIWGQSEVGCLQPIEAAGRLCQAASVPLHVDATQVVGHQTLAFDALPVSLLSCAAHKLQGPRGIGLLLQRAGLGLCPQIGGAQEEGLRGGTEPVVLAAGFAQALAEAGGRLARHGGRDPLAERRDQLRRRLNRVPGCRLSGPDPERGEARLPHHLSLLLSSPEGRALDGREVVRRLARLGMAVSSGSACSARSGGAQGGGSPVLRAMGYSEAEARSGLRISLGPWHDETAVEPLVDALSTTLRDLARC